MYSGVLSTGSSQTNGVELLIEKRGQKIYGLIGATYFNVIYDDYDNISRNRDYTCKYIMNVVGGYRPEAEWEFSEVVYFGGKPYTPIDEVRLELGDEVLFLDQWNEHRTPAYHSLFSSTKTTKIFNPAT